MSRVKVAATPAARRVAKENKIQLEAIQGSGPFGSVTLADIQAHGKAAIKYTRLAAVIARENGLDISKIPARGRIKKADVLAYMKMGGQRIPHTAIRRMIADNMSRSNAEIPQYRLFGQWQIGEMCAFMADYKEARKKAGGVSPTYTDLFVKAVALSLKECAIVNSSFQEDYVQLHSDVNVGIAVSIPGGLIVPNIKHADTLSLEAISEERLRLVTLAREGKLMPDDYSGGSFTISNLGSYPLSHMTPLINPPESGILGIGRIEDKVVPVEDGIGIRPVIGISASFDHRHVDGAVGAHFLSVLEKKLKAPERL